MWRAAILATCDRGLDVTSMGEWKMPPYPVEKNGTQNARKGRLYARRKKKDRRQEALTGQASATKWAKKAGRMPTRIVVCPGFPFL